MGETCAPGKGLTGENESLGVRLRDFDNSGFDRGRSRLTEALWIAASALFVESRLPGSGHRRVLFRLFGARVGKRVAVKPGVRVKFPWRLSIGDDSWIGEDVWIDNLDQVTIGRDCCVSQGAYLCTGSHDWTSPSFDLITKPIMIGNGAWIAAKASLGPGAVAGDGAVLTMGSVGLSRLEPWGIYRGVPAMLVSRRRISQNKQGAGANIAL
jgi:putative colanic acid biosynthesis acetyltransferase WcaF